jgi:hypothetical protein
MSQSKKSIHPLVLRFIAILEKNSEYNEVELKCLALILQIQNGHPRTPEFLETLRYYAQSSWTGLTFSDKDWNTLVESGYLNSICTILTDAHLD